jgi:hypothetical protein
VALHVKLVRAARVKHVPALETWDGGGSALRLGIGGDDVDGRCADNRLMKSRSPPSQDVGRWISWGHSLGTDGVQCSSRPSSLPSRMSHGGLLEGDRGSGRGGDDREGGGEGEGGDVGMAHTGSTRSIGAAAGRGHSPEEAAAGPMQGAQRGGGQRKKERAEGGRRTCATARDVRRGGEGGCVGGERRFLFFHARREGEGRRAGKAQRRISFFVFLFILFRSRGKAGVEDSRGILDRLHDRKSALENILPPFQNIFRY